LQQILRGGSTNVSLYDLGQIVDGSLAHAVLLEMNSDRIIAA